MSERVIVGGGDEDLEEALTRELLAFNVEASGVGDQQEFTVRVESENGELLGGLCGWTWGTAAGIALMWVFPGRRRAGIGSRLLQAAESVAVERGCRQMSVTSFTFQAPGFYEHHGYELTGRTEGIPTPDHAHVQFRKLLRMPPSALRP